MVIKGVILDIDGVIVGEKIGFNSPYPHPSVLEKLKEIRSKGIFISLCTGKPYFAIQEIIEKSNLNNLHITQGGAVITDPLNNIVHAHSMEKSLAEKLLKSCLDNNIYLEVYTENSYIIQSNQKSNITKEHAHILQREPDYVDSLADFIQNNTVTRMMPIANDMDDKKRVGDLLKQYENDLVYSWGIHPVALPLQFLTITPGGISKDSASKEVVEKLDISFESILAAGDTNSDWQFLQHCGYVATLENGADKLKKLVSSKEKSFIGPSVDENGILEIFKHFGL